MSGKDYRKLCQTQHRVLEILQPVLGNFYLTGGTALGRFYLNHRYSEDLDFFINQSDSFKTVAGNCRQLLSSNFQLITDQSLVYDDFIRFYLEEDDCILKIEFVNDIPYRSGSPIRYTYGLIDTPFNILSNKLGALVGRDEPKDIADILGISTHYRFNWVNIFKESREKCMVNELDVEQRLKSFPGSLLQTIDWIHPPDQSDSITRKLEILADDFLLGRDNSLGMDMPPIEEAVPQFLF
ncbi:MAG: nucleotidyl transferase AbiEii/AbiGii toxin family protein [Bacteroidales bacterium]